jgi:hypothetical protein
VLVVLVVLVAARHGSLVRRAPLGVVDQREQGAAQLAHAPGP